MRSEYTLKCKFCDAKKHWVSHWLPVEVLQAFANIWILFHALRKHPDKMTKSRFKYAAKQTFWSMVIIVLFFLLTILRIVFFPLWWLLDKLYE